MANLQDILNLAKADGGKFFVLDQNGDVKLVILPVEDYQKMLLGKLQKQVVDAEKVNKEIIKAQLLEEPSIEPVVQTVKPPIHNSPIKPSALRPDLREEVIDLSFDFEGPRQDFDDI